MQSSTQGRLCITLRIDLRQTPYCPKKGIHYTALLSEGIKINITVADCNSDDNSGSAATKTVKTGWENGDQISIWYDSNTGDTPDLVIEYNRSTTKWSAASATVSGNTPSTGGGFLKAVYSSGLIVAANNIAYTYDGSELTADINSWTYLTEIQVVVSGLTSGDAAQYRLASKNLTPCTGYTVGSGAITATKGTKGATAKGVSNTAGVAFVFATTDYTAASYKFSLFKYGATAQEFTASRAISEVTNHASVKAIKIASTGFADASHDYVNIDGVNWATANVGATNGSTAASWYGDYYAWGEVKPYYSSISFTSASDATFTWSIETTGWGGTSTGKTSGYDFTSYCGNSSFQEWDTAPYDNNVLKSAYDAASYNWGSGWRMPTGGDTGEFKTLVEACSIGLNSENKYIISTGWDATTHSKGIYGVTDYQGISGLNGKVFCDGTNYVFFPAAGVFNGSRFQSGSSNVYCWSSSLGTTSTSKAWRVFFTSYTIQPLSECSRYYGLSVRPVVAE